MSYLNYLIAAYAVFVVVLGWDFVQLGAGAAGLTAALAAATSGASVGLFEKADVVGGEDGVDQIVADARLALLDLQPIGEEIHAYSVANCFTKTEEDLAHSISKPIAGNKSKTKENLSHSHTDGHSHA